MRIPHNLCQPAAAADDDDGGDDDGDDDDGGGERQDAWLVGLLRGTAS